MGLNAKQFAEKAGRKDASIVKEWYDAGYLGHATKDKKTGVYDIPEDTPIPYSANKKTQLNSTLWSQLLDAADKNQMVASSMYPLISDDDFEFQLQQMTNDDLLELVSTNSGSYYLRLKASGVKFINQYSNKRDRKSALEKAERLINNGANIISILQALIAIGFKIASMA